MNHEQQQKELQALKKEVLEVILPKVREIQADFTASVKTLLKAASNIDEAQLRLITLVADEVENAGGPKKSTPIEVGDLVVESQVIEKPAKKKTSTPKKRKCGRCGEPGHNARSCGA